MDRPDCNLVQTTDLGSFTISLTPQQYTAATFATALQDALNAARQSTSKLLNIMGFDSTLPSNILNRYSRSRSGTRLVDLRGLLLSTSGLRSRLIASDPDIERFNVNRNIDVIRLSLRDEDVIQHEYHYRAAHNRRRSDSLSQGHLLENSTQGIFMERKTASGQTQYSAIFYKGESALQLRLEVEWTSSTAARGPTGNMDYTDGLTGLSAAVATPSRPVLVSQDQDGAFDFYNHFISSTLKKGTGTNYEYFWDGSNGGYSAIVNAWRQIHFLAGTASSTGSLGFRTIPRTELKR